MNGTGIDRAVHDYLDGRLSEEERRAFEARLEREPELARTLEAYREAGRILRDPPIDLPPGFHARARSRFEASRPARSDWKRFLSWETTGLVAAAVILTALIFPEVWERYRQRPEAPLERSTLESPAASAESKSLPTEGEDSIEPSGGRAMPDLEHSRDEPAEDPREKRRIGAEPKGWADDDPGIATLDEVAEKELAAAPSPVPERPRAAADEKDRATRRDRAVAEGFAKQEAQAAPRHDAGADSHLGRSEEAGEFAPAPATAPTRGKKGPAAPRTTTLPAGVVGEGELILIEEAGAWESFLRRMPEDPSPALHPDFTSERVAVVGPATGLESCDALRVVESSTRLVIVWPLPSEERAVTGGGCAVLIPADGRPVYLAQDP